MFLTYLWRELRHRHRQAALTALGLALGVGLVVTVSAAAAGVSTAQTKVLHSLYGVGTDISVSKSASRGSGAPQQFSMTPGSRQKAGQAFSRDRLTASAGLSLISESKVASVRSLKGVSSAVGGLTLSSMQVSGKFAQVGGSSSTSSAATPSSTSGTSAKASQSPIKVTSFTVTGVDVTDQSIGPLSSTTISSGRSFASSQTDAKVVVVDAGYAKQSGLSVGDTMKIGGASFKVIGICKSAASSSDVYMPLKVAQTISGEAGEVDHIYVKATSATAIAQVKTKVAGIIPGATVTTAQDLASQVSGSLGSAAKLAKVFGRWLALAAMSAAVAVASLLTLSAVGRRVREFGTLKALGWRSRRIVSQVLGEATVTGLVGGLAGLGLALAATAAIAHFSPALQATVGGSGTTGQGFAGAIQSAANTVTVTLRAAISPQLAVLAVLLALAGALVAGCLGGWRAARLSPAEALRRVD